MPTLNRFIKVEPVLGSFITFPCLVLNSLMDGSKYSHQDWSSVTLTKERHYHIACFLYDVANINPFSSFSGLLTKETISRNVAAAQIVYDSRHISYAHTKIFWNCFDWHSVIFSNEDSHISHIPFCRSRFRQQKP